MPKDQLIRTIKKERPGIIFIANPNAPTGNLFDPDVLRKVVEITDCLVVVDEAYYPFSDFTVIDWTKQYDNLVILRTFSKAFSLGGLRLGWMVAEPEVSRMIEKCLLPFCINKLVYATALAVLDSPNYLKKYMKAINTERERVYKALKSLYSLTVYPSKTNFILFETDNADLLFKKLLEQKVIVRQMNDGRRLRNALRVTIGSKEENDAFLYALRKVLK